MIKKELDGFDTTAYTEELENGLKIILVPLNNRKSFRINYFTKYGAEINEFVPLGEKKKIKVPYGVAHFLEHKVFEQESGEDPFSFFAKYGCDANASTGYKTTSYTVEGSNNIEENLEYLLNYVNSPYFTDENVEKEKGIIIEEINMYKDEPEGKLFDQSNKAVFKKHPCRVDVGGTEKSVRSITKEILYKCYNTFYQPSNMYLVIVGKFDIDSVLKVIKNNKKLNARKSDGPIKIIKTKEPVEVNISKKELKINNIALPKFILTFKSRIEELSKEELYKRKVAIDIFLYSLYGTSSLFREEMLNKGLMTFLYTSRYITDDILTIEVTAESKEPNKLFNEILKRYKTAELTEEEVERIKKVRIANLVYSADKVGSVMNGITSLLVNYDELICNELEIIKSVTLEDVKKVKDYIDINNYSYVVGYPKE